jgi:hypothetical protein
MNLKRKKIRIFFFCIIFVFFGILSFFFFSKNAHAVELNISYPSIPGGNSFINSTSTVPAYLKYVFDVGMFLGIMAAVVSLAIAGIYYLLSPAIPGATEKAKDRIYGSFSGLLILLLVYLILTTINPSLSFFYVKPLDPVDFSPDETLPTPGVYLYKNTGCSLSSGEKEIVKTSSESDLGDLKNRIQSAKIVQDGQNDSYYISLLFQSTDYWKKCFYVNPAGNCNKNITPPFASSIAIYQPEFRPSGGDITFYREPFFGSKGGSFKVAGSETYGSNGKVYIKSLNDLNFMSNPYGDINNPDDCSVPKEKMDCIQWDDKGICTKRKCPNLSEKNIGSIKINGNYVVMLIYYGPEDTPAGPWSSCQIFPTPDDKARLGPNKIKWENIENENRIPNYVAIIPVKDNTNPDTTLNNQN